MVVIYLLLILILIYIYIYFIETFLVDDNFDIPIYDNNDINMNGYNIGDLLNMPSFWVGWNRNPHHNQDKYDAFLNVSKNYPNTIVYYYFKLRNDNTEPIPNMEKIEEAIKLYIINNDVSNIINKVNDDNTLCVHLRSGDKGIVDDDYINKINDLSNKYNKIIILCGIHSDQNFESNEISKKNLIKSLQKINNNKIEIHIDKADNHLVMMNKCKNLLIHRGGFSILGSIIFNGNNLYYTNIFEPHTNNEIINHIKNKNINYIMI